MVNKRDSHDGLGGGHSVKGRRKGVGMRADRRTEEIVKRNRWKVAPRVP